MCGFLISLSKNNIDSLLWEDAFKSIQHRGPDNSKVKLYNDKSINIKFGFHRLSIVDHKNSASNQPFVTENSILVFNGEIYNYLFLKKKLIERKIKFRTNSDTEVLVRYLETFGLSKTLNDLDGMWSFAWFLKKKKKLFLARDRYGEKPLYYYKDSNQFVISSEIKAILILTKKKFYVEKTTTANFLNLGLVNYDNKTLFSKIFQIPPSYYSVLNVNSKFNFKLIKYFDFKKERNNSSFENNLLLLKKKLTQSLISRLPNEVKFGILISGGVDSTINFSIVKKLIPPKKINLFFAESLNKNNKDNQSISFLENYYKLKINKIRLPKQNRKIFKYFNKLIWINDYPLASIAAVNQYLMGVEARKKNIKVLISGQGADELFFGYLKYYSFYLMNLIKNKKILAFFINLFYLIKNDFFSQIKIYNALRYLNFNFLDKSKFFSNNFLQIPNNYKNFKNLKKRSFDDMNKFSVPTLCQTEDRMYMASGIETRFPYLNANLQKFSLSLPDTFKLSFGFTKYILRKAFVNELPNKLLFRKDKEGFDTGKDFFLKKNQIFLQKNILNEDSLIFKEKIVSIKFLKYFNNYLNSFFFKRNYDLNFLFRVISFEIWLHVFKKYLNFNNR
jgi:asparagine synthase (glutamine-hydrolysing)